MSEEKNNIEVIPEFKMYITDLETNKDSKEINVSDLIFNDYIEFEFGDYEDEDYGTLPYKDFKFFINDYSVTFYSPQMNNLQQKIEEKDKEIDRLNNIINELEKTLKEEVKELYNEENPMLLDETYIKYATERKMAYMYILDKLKELKENNK